MEILKINENKKLEIYEMKLNLQKAQFFREEQSKNIKFLQIKMADYAAFEKMLSPFVFDLIYHPCCCDLIFGCKNLETNPNYTISTYAENDFTALQKDFLTQYIVSGLNRYPFQLDLQKGDNSMLRAYLFLVKMLSFGNHFCSMDQVVSFPNEAIVLYLLEHGDIKTAISFLEPKNWEKIIDCFDFISASPFQSQNAMISDDFARSQAQTLALHKNIIQHMKNVA